MPTILCTVRLCKEVLANKTPGDFVECGVFAGAHPILMGAVLMNDDEVKRRVRLYDSFLGIPEAGDKDDETITGCIGVGSGILKSTGVSVCSRQSVANHIANAGIDSNLMVYYEGWFQHTVAPSVNDYKHGIAILRLDGDLYESTKVCMEHLHPLVNKGGYVIVDDYALTGCKRAIDEYHMTHNLNPGIIEIKGGGGPIYYKL